MVGMVLALTSVCLAFAVSRVEACSCVTGVVPQTYPEHVRQQFGEAYAVFSAEAVAVGRDSVTFRLIDVWKGELPRELSMEAAPDPDIYPDASSSSCDYLFRAGRRYLIFAYGASVATMKTRSCTPTGQLMMIGEQYVSDATVAILDALVPGRSKPKETA